MSEQYQISSPNLGTSKRKFNTQEHALSIANLAGKLYAARLAVKEAINVERIRTVAGKTIVETVMVVWPHAAV